MIWNSFQIKFFIFRGTFCLYVRGVWTGIFLENHVRYIYPPLKLPWPLKIDPLEVWRFLHGNPAFFRGKLLVSGRVISMNPGIYGGLTVDGQNPAPPRMMIIPLFTWFYTSQVVSRISSINSTIHPINPCGCCFLKASRCGTCGGITSLP